MSARVHVCTPPQQEQCGQDKGEVVVPPQVFRAPAPLREALGSPIASPSDPSTLCRSVSGVKLKSDGAMARDLLILVYD